MKDIITWAIDLISNFKLHLFFISFALLLLSVFLLHSIFIALISVALFVYAMFPLDSWYAKRINTGREPLKKFRICSFNIDWKASEYDKTLTYIEDLTSDIVVLQEVPASLNTHVTNLKHVFPYQCGEGHSHVMVLSKHKLTFVEYLPWPSKFQQRALHVIAELEGWRVNIFAMHLQWVQRFQKIFSGCCFLE